MEGENKVEQVSNQKIHPKGRVHRILAHSYTVFFVLFLISVLFDFIFQIKIFNSSIMAPIGVFFLILSTIIILWAQKTGRDFKKLENKDVRAEHFLRGPYYYTRSPTHFGLLFLMLGFGMIANAFFVILFTIVSFLITKFYFLNKQESILTEKYGAHYTEYKKQVKF